MGPSTGTNAVALTTEALPLDKTLVFGGHLETTPQHALRLNAYAADNQYNPNQTNTNHD